MPIRAYYPDGSHIVVPPEDVKDWQSQYKRGLTTLGLAVWYQPLEAVAKPDVESTVPDGADVPVVA